MSKLSDSSRTNFPIAINRIEKHILFYIMGMLVFLFSFHKNTNMLISHLSVHFYDITKTAFDITIVNGMYNCKRIMYHILNNGTQY